MEGAEAVTSALGDVDPVTVFDVVSRLVDKSLVIVEERPDGEQHYRLLETLRVYALDTSACRRRARSRSGTPTWRSGWIGWRARSPCSTPTG